MAYQTNYRDQEEDQPQNGSTPSTSGIIDGQTGSTITTDTPAASQAVTPGTGFVNLQSYLDANKGAGANLAGDTTSDLSKQADQFKSDAGNLVKGTNFSSANGSATAAQVNSGLKTDASGTKKLASSFLSQKYGGPTADAASADLNANKTALQTSLGQVDDPSTIQASLADTYGKRDDGTGKTGNYNQGFGLLDSFLEQGDQSGRDALAAVKAKSADVGDAYQNAYGQLSTGEQAARQQLARNQAGVLSNAKSDLSNVISGGQRGVQSLNAGLDPSLNDHTAQASLGDALTAKQQQDLAALAALTKTNPSDNWFKKTYSAGTAKPTPPPQPVATPTSPGTPNDPVTAWNAPEKLANANQAVMNAINNGQDKVTTASQDANNQIAGVAQQLGDPNAQAEAQAVNNALGGLGNAADASREKPANWISQAAPKLRKPKW